MTNSPHASQPILRAGIRIPEADAVLILLHGRGGSAADILALGGALAPPNWAFLAPQAAQHTWYPYSFLTAREQNEPWLSSALDKVEQAIDEALAEAMALSRVFVAGFSQGACLATEFVGRHTNRYGGLLAFTGGLIGPLQEPIELTGDLAGTPILLSAGDPDPHVPWARVEQSAQLLRSIGGDVTLERYPGKPHSIDSREIEAGRQLFAAQVLAG